MASSSSKVCPVGAVSMITKRRFASFTAREKAWKTAISSVHGERRSSSRAARPASSRAAPPLVRSTVAR
nr:hypothetical protein DA06_05940 [Georgenia sp. SUBG003]